jgi:effector-binding domain-containing protein
MEYQVRVEQAAPQLTGVVRRRCRQDELSTVVPHACGEVWAFFRSAGLPRPGRHVALYLDCAINLEVGVEVDQPFAGDQGVFCSSTPAGMVVTVAHLGPYNRLHDAHQAICQWCAANGHTLAGPNWEVYGHWTDDPAQLRTDVFYLLKS